MRYWDKNILDVRGTSFQRKRLKEAGQSNLYGTLQNRVRINFHRGGACRLTTSSSSTVKNNNTVLSAIIAEPISQSISNPSSAKFQQEQFPISSGSSSKRERERIPRVGRSVDDSGPPLFISPISWLPCRPASV